MSRASPGIARALQSSDRSSAREWRNEVATCAAIGKVSGTAKECAGNEKSVEGQSIMCVQSLNRNIANEEHGVHVHLKLLFWRLVVGHLLCALRDCACRHGPVDMRRQRRPAQRLEDGVGLKRRKVPVPHHEITKRACRGYKHTHARVNVCFSDSQRRTDAVPTTSPLRGAIVCASSSATSMASRSPVRPPALALSALPLPRLARFGSGSTLTTAPMKPSGTCAVLPRS